MRKRNPKIEIEVISKYNDSVFLSYLEQKYGRECCRVVSRNPLLYKSQKEKLEETWQEYLSEVETKAVYDRFENNSDLQSILLFGNCVNRY